MMMRLSSFRIGAPRGRMPSNRSASRSDAFESERLEVGRFRHEKPKQTEKRLAFRFEN